MIVAAVALIVLAMVMYFFAPSGKTEMFAGVAASLVGFLTGKFSNGFGKPMTAAPSVPAVEEDPDDAPSLAGPCRDHSPGTMTYTEDRSHRKENPDED
jgi:hypothetical protein